MAENWAKEQSLVEGQGEEAEDAGMSVGGATQHAALTAAECTAAAAASRHRPPSPCRQTRAWQSIRRSATETRCAPQMRQMQLRRHRLVSAVPALFSCRR